MRTRDCFWGLDDLTDAETSRVVVSNRLYMHFLALCEAASSRGGMHGWEHPADRGAPPYPSIFATSEMQGMEARTGSRRAVHHQCVWGCERPKKTCITGNLFGLDSMDQCFCPGVSDQHVHTGVSWGRDSSGKFHSSRLQAYPTQYAKKIASLIFASATELFESGKGPTGSIRTDTEIIRSTNYGHRHRGTQKPAVTLLNEDMAHCRHTLLDSYQSASYLHVDDLLCLSVSSALAVHADKLMAHMAASLRGIGFKVPEESCQCDFQLDKIIGYTIWRDLGRFTVDTKKWVCIRGALLELAAIMYINVEVLRSIAGVWMFAALVRRDCISIPFHIFKFMELYEGKVVRLPAVVKDEILAMAAAVPLLYFSYSDCFGRSVFATDAMGDNDVDNGGYAVVCRGMSDSMLSEVLEVGCAPGRTIARLHGELSGAKYPCKRLVSTKPFSLLSDRWFEAVDWTPLCRGRWRFSDGIILGESRAVNKMLNIVSVFRGSQNSNIFGLQDNTAVAGASNKGRSSAMPLNRTLRKRAAILLAKSIRLILPWVQSAAQPADQGSRTFY